ncbi:MAG: formate dehydrogenase accessory protein FdhE [Vicinamibacterales bacterium]
MVELRALKARQPDLADAVDMQLELLEHQRRIQLRIPLPWFELNSAAIARHQAEARPLVRFEEIPLELTDLRLLVRQTADVLRRHGALDESAYAHVQTLGRDMKLHSLAGEWYSRATERHATAVAAVGTGPDGRRSDGAGDMLDEVLALAMRPFLSRCAEVLQRADLSAWTHGHCPLCGGEPDLAVITPAAERHLICGRCTLHWKFEPLTCPFCNNSDRSRITSFATPDGQYRVYGCDACQRYLKCYDARRASRPVMPIVDSIATLPLDAAAMQRGYSA